MELLSKLGIDWRLLLWQVVNFLVVLYVLQRFAFKPLVETLSARARKIEQGIKDAEAAAAARLAAEREREEILHQAREQAGQVLTAARTEADNLRSELMGKAKVEAEAVIAAGQAKLRDEKEAMIRSAGSELGELVIEAVEKIVPRTLDKSDHQKLLAEAAQAFKDRL